MYDFEDSEELFVCELWVVEKVGVEEGFSEVAEEEVIVVDEVVESFVEGGEVVSGLESGIVGVSLIELFGVI